MTVAKWYATCYNSFIQNEVTTMSRYLKRAFAVALCCATMVGAFAGCGGKKTEEKKEPASTEPVEEKKVLKVLTLGHSLTVDACHMLNLVADTEGLGDYDEIVIGTLYYSGCQLWRHVQYLKANEAAYSLYLSSTKTPDVPPRILDNMTMEAALRLDYWDIIVMQGGAWEIGEPENFTNGNIQTIQQYVNDNKYNPNAVFAWHMPWAIPTDPELLAKYPYEPNPHKNNYAKYGNNRETLYNAITNCVAQHIVPDETFEFLIPTGTAMQNAWSSYLTEKDIHRDYGHATDFARVMVTYVWYCKLMGIEKLEQIKLDAIPAAFLKSTEDKSKDRPLTQIEKELILESVNNALAEPLKMTQSRYTEAPEQ